MERLWGKALQPSSFSLCHENFEPIAIEFLNGLCACGLWCGLCLYTICSNLIFGNSYDVVFCHSAALCNILWFRCAVIVNGLFLFSSGSSKSRSRSRSSSYSSSYSKSSHSRSSFSSRWEDNRCFYFLNFI